MENENEPEEPPKSRFKEEEFQIHDLPEEEPPLKDPDFQVGGSFPLDEPPLVVPEELALDLPEEGLPEAEPKLEDLPGSIQGFGRDGCWIILFVVVFVIAVGKILEWIFG